MRVGQCFLLCFFLVSAGCAVNTASGQRDSFYFGLIRLKSAKLAENGYREKVGVLGFWSDVSGGSGVSTGIGFKARSLLSLPLGCEIIIIIKNEKIEDNIQHLVNSLNVGGKSPCIISEK